MVVENLTVAGSNSFGKGGLVWLYDVQSSADGAEAPTLPDAAQPAARVEPFT